MKVFIDKSVHASIEKFYDTLPDGEEIVRINDACHSLIYHE